MTQDVPRVTLQAHRYHCSNSTVVSIRGVVIYSSLMENGLRFSNKYKDGYPRFVSTQSKFTRANRGVRIALGILNANRKIRKRTDTDVAFTREYSRVSIFHRERECTN